MASDTTASVLRQPASPTDDRPSAEARRASMRDQIKQVATDLLVRHGYRGVSFGNIAPLLGTTRANIHYHFGSKRQLVERVLEEYVEDTLARYRSIWTDPSMSFDDKVKASAAFNRERYVKFNTPHDNGNSWSLISRLRNDSDVIGEAAVDTLRRFGQEIEVYMSEAATMAVRKGEFVADAPVDAIVVQIVSIANTAGQITQDAGNFERLQELYLAFAETVRAAYGSGAARR
jgi:TetR/AcrR family transcriptional repressor of nem operon